jgi:hypothetical protein
MLSSTHIEDVFVEFYEFSHSHGVPVQPQDVPAIQSFYDVLLSGSQLTEAQSSFILKILHKYKNLVAIRGFDYGATLESPKWKNSFRVLDTEKKIYVDTDSSGAIWVCLKFPFVLKKAFEDTLQHVKTASVWDPDLKVRKINLYNCNLVQIGEFVQQHGFVIDESFLTVLGQVEEIWANQSKILPSSTISNNAVELVNADNDALTYWNKNKTGNLETDLLLAKSMGFLLEKKAENAIERIAATKPNQYWVKDNKELLSLCNQIDGKVCIILDRVGNTKVWLKEFADSVDACGVDRNLVKVCFRVEKNDSSNLNEWVKENGFGGNIADGKFLIFNHKPAKWLFKESDSVKILVSNNLYPSTNAITRDWFNSHPLVIYVGTIKPSEQRNKNIVEL